MTHLTHRIRLALLSLTIIGMAHPCPAQAQQPAKETLAFKASYAGTYTSAAVGGPMPLIYADNRGTGSHDLLGDSASHDSFWMQTGAEGLPIFVPHGASTWSNAAGDALFLTWVAVIRPPTAQGTLPYEGAFIITGGSGRFTGATGSGSFTGRGEGTDKDFVTYQGVTVLPKR